jgi:hypothetical protein
VAAELMAMVDVHGVPRPPEPPRPAHPAAVGRPRTRLAALLAPLLLASCAEAAPDAAVLHDGARVQVVTARAAGTWTSGVVGSAGPCLTVMVPDTWSAPRRFEVVPVDSLTAVRVSSVYDGIDRHFDFDAAADTADERWISLPIDRVRRRHGDCAVHP